MRQCQFCTWEAYRESHPRVGPSKAKPGRNNQLGRRRNAATAQAAPITAPMAPPARIPSSIRSPPSSKLESISIQHETHPNRVIPKLACNYLPPLCYFKRDSAFSHKHTIRHLHFRHSGAVRVLVRLNGRFAPNADIQVSTLMGYHRSWTL